MYRGYVVEDISCKKGKQYVKFHSIPDAIKVGEIFGSASKDDYQRWQIRQTIREHLNRELIILHEGLKIKVLSLFFLDSVSNYRVYDDDGKPMSGKLVRVFEEEYNNEIKRSKYALLNDYVPASDLHNGYFAKDKKTGKFKDSRGSDDNTDEGYSAYELIMREKEKLLSFDTKLKFIFTHSALREGWDNPNVFQICTLNERSADAKIAKKQEIGRGLRLPVDQNGTRILDNQKVNVLTVIANESYEEFVANLQRDIENDRGRKFGAINRRAFVGIKLDETSYTDEKANDAIITYLKEKEYLDGDDKFTLHKSTGKTKFEVDADNGSFELSDLPDECSINRKAVFDSILQEAKNSRTDVYEVGDKRNQRVIKPKEEVLMSETFSWLWDKIKYKTKYEISVDTDDLVKACIPEVRKIIVGKTEARYKKRGVSFDKEDGIQSKEDDPITSTNDSV